MKGGMMNMENKETQFHKGVENITVEMFDHPKNYAHTIVEHVTSTWGDEKFENNQEKRENNRKNNLCYSHCKD